jgi:class 3 adenylate cyclase
LDLPLAEVVSSSVYVGTVDRAVLHTDVLKSSSKFERDSVRASLRINRDLAGMDEVANQHDGIVERDTGDGRIFIFESAARALEAAVAMQDFTLQANARREPGEPSIYHRIGAHVGPVVVVDSTAGGRSVRKFTGDTVVIAARLQQMSPPGDVLLSQEFMEASRGANYRGEMRHYGKHKLNNLEEPVNVYVAKVGRITEGSVKATATKKMKDETAPAARRGWFRPAFWILFFVVTVSYGTSTWINMKPKDRKGIEKQIGDQIEDFVKRVQKLWPSPEKDPKKSSPTKVVKQDKKSGIIRAVPAQNLPPVDDGKIPPITTEKDKSPVTDIGPIDPYDATGNEGESQVDADINDAIEGRDPLHPTSDTIAVAPGTSEERE